MEALRPSQIDRLRGEPHGAQLLDALAGERGVYLVGGAVRDLLLGEPIIDYDFTAEGDAPAVADRVAAAVGAKVKTHARFGTATLKFEDGTTVDFATTRSEAYPSPGVLPDVAAGTLEQDLARRDFTVNAIAAAVDAERLGELEQFPAALADLKAKVLRVTYDESFVDDPTRLLRLLRYGARLGFTAEPYTEELARRAVASNALRNVGGSRIRDELMDLLGERNAVVAIDSMAALGLDQQLHDRFFADEYVAARAIMQLTDGVRQDLVLLAACCRGFAAGELEQWLTSIALTRQEIKLVVDAAVNAQQIATALAAADRPSEVDAVLSAHAVEAAVLASALPGNSPETQEKVLQWLGRESRTLLIDGGDLTVAGIAPGPHIGRALARVRAAALDDELTSRDEQLEAALRWAREGAARST